MNRFHATAPTVTESRDGLSLSPCCPVGAGARLYEMTYDDDSRACVRALVSDGMMEEGWSTIQLGTRHGKGWNVHWRNGCRLRALSHAIASTQPPLVDR